MIFGNAAKYFIRREILQHLATTTGKLTVVDLGCGDCSQWQWLHDEQPDRVALVGFEPSRKAVSNARKKFPDWEFLDRPAYDAARWSGAADIVTSLSALEHVYRRQAFMQTAADLLKPHGIFYLNYDNGHFFGGEKIGTAVGQILVKLGIERWYQDFVWQNEVEALIQKAGLDVLHELNFHQATYKSFAKVLGRSEHTEFHEAWLNYELQVNELLKRDPQAWDLANSNQFLLSKVFVLRKAAPTG